MARFLDFVLAGIGVVTAVYGFYLLSLVARLLTLPDTSDMTQLIRSPALLSSPRWLALIFFVGACLFFLITYTSWNLVRMANKKEGDPPIIKFRGK